MAQTATRRLIKMSAPVHQINDMVAVLPIYVPFLVRERRPAMQFAARRE